MQTGIMGKPVWEASLMIPGCTWYMGPRGPSGVKQKQMFPSRIFRSISM